MQEKEFAFFIAYPRRSTFFQSLRFMKASQSAERDVVRGTIKFWDVQESRLLTLYTGDNRGTKSAMHNIFNLSQYGMSLAVQHLEILLE